MRHSRNQQLFLPIAQNASENYNNYVVKTNIWSVHSRALTRLLNSTRTLNPWFLFLISLVLFLSLPLPLFLLRLFLLLLCAIFVCRSPSIVYNFFCFVFFVVYFSFSFHFFFHFMWDVLSQFIVCFSNVSGFFCVCVFWWDERFLCVNLFL